MSLNAMSTGVGQPLSTTTDTLLDTTRPVTDTVSNTASSTNLPGTFPKEEPPTGEKNKITIPSFSDAWTSFLTWLKSLLPRSIDIFEAAVRRFILWLIPPERQAEMYKAILDHPIAATFVACQLICCGVPLALFIAGTMIFAAVAVIVWVVLSLLLLGPIVLVASLMGVSLWGWGWFVFGLVKWLDKLVLGGVMERYWVAQLAQQKSEAENRENGDHKVTSSEKEKKVEKKEKKEKKG